MSIIPVSVSRTQWGIPTEIAASLPPSARFTALLHHVDVGLLTRAYFWLKKDAAPGIDGMTWAQYGEDLAVRLKDLHCRVHRATG